MYLCHQKEHVLEHLSAKTITVIKKENATEALAVHIIVSHKTDHLQLNRQLNLIYRQNPRAKFKHMWRQLRNTATLNQMVRRIQIKYTNTTIPATIIYPQQPVDAFRLSSQLEKTSSYPRNTLKLKKSETLLSST